MFDKAGLEALYNEHRETLKEVNAVADALNDRFYKMSDAIECLLIAAISGEPMVMIGPPGTAKSRLIRAFCNLLELVPSSAMGGVCSDSTYEPNEWEDESSLRGDEYFEYLLTQFTEPSELFGFYDLAKIDTEGLVRKDKNMMQMAQVVFLDEVFNASSAILNSLLTFMNERKFHDRGEVIETPLRLLVSATNHPPREANLSAVYDRFLLRCWISNTTSAGVDEEDLIGLLDAGWIETHAANYEHRRSWPELWGRIIQLQDDIKHRTANGELQMNREHMMFADLTQLVRSVIKLELSEMSNRRLIKLAGVVLCMRLLRSARDGSDAVEIESRDLDVILRFGLDREDPSAQAKLHQELALS